MVARIFYQPLADLFAIPTMQSYFGQNDIAFWGVVETPQDRYMGDIALPCFQYAKLLQKAPPVIADDVVDIVMSIVEQIPWLDKVVAAGPYVNFFVNTSWLAHHIIRAIHIEAAHYGQQPAKQECLVIESPGPNTNKPLHLGHVRNMLLGNSLAAIAEAAGYEVKKVDIINDRGVHICKSMLAYQRWGHNALPSKKSDHYVGDWYVRYAQAVAEDPSIEEEVQTMLLQREQGDPVVRALWQKMRDWALDGMRETYARYGCYIDKVYYESDHYTMGKDIVETGLDRGIFMKNEKGNIIYKDATCGEKVVLRADGTSIYITQDIALAQLRYDDWTMDRMVYVVGSEQEHHFQCLFAIFAALGYPFAEQCYHMSYGMISLPEGKMKSREGNVVDADTLADDMHARAKALLIERHANMSHDALALKAEQIAMAAIKFFILLYDPKKDFVFDREASLRFDGESGPYIQYTYARCQSLLKKATYTGHKADVDYTLLVTEEERMLLVFLADFTDTIQLAADTYQPYLIARYVLDLTRMFNRYYQTYPILQDTNMAVQQVRLELVASVAQVIHNALALLGIASPENM